jgi:hypothetical protein
MYVGQDAMLRHAYGVKPAIQGIDNSAYRDLL